MCVLQPLLPPPILLGLGIVLFATGEGARFKNYQKHGGGEVSTSCLFMTFKVFAQAQPSIYTFLH